MLHSSQLKFIGLLACNVRVLLTKETGAPLFR